MRYKGGKTHYKKRLANLYPEYSEIREPFMGGSICLKYADPKSKKWYNEKNPLVYDFWQTLKSEPEFVDELADFAKHINSLDYWDRIEWFESSRLAIDNLRKRLTGLGWEAPSFPTLKQYQQAKTDIEYSPLDWYLVNEWSLKSPPQLKRNNIATACMLYVESGLSGKPLNLLRMHERLQGVKLTCLDYSEVLQAPGDNVFMVLDPPYICNGNKNLYDGEEWGKECHQKLAEQLKQSSHKWLLTIGASLRTKHLYKDFDISFVPYKRSQVHKRNSDLDIGGEYWIRNC